MDRAEPGSPDSGWNRYWAGAGAAGAYAAGGVSHPSIDAFWRQFFDSIPDLGKDLRIVDLATGNGAMIERMIRHDISAEAITCVDLSPAAIESVEKRFPGVRGVVADMGSPALPNGQFHLVTSQFGIEYGGESALSAAPGLVAPSGVLAMLAHATDSLISRESAANLAAIEAYSRRACSRLVLPRFAAPTGHPTTQPARRFLRPCSPSKQSSNSSDQVSLPARSSGYTKTLHEFTRDSPVTIQTKS